MKDFKGVKKIYFIGIGGIGMSAVAGIAKEKGYEILGSDSSDLYDPAKSVLDLLGIKYLIGYDAEHIIASKPDLVVVTAGVDDANPELSAALRVGLEVISYPEMLAELAKDKKRIVVVGTHGKGTTAGLLGYALQSITDSSFFVGAVLNNLGTNFYSGTGEYFVIEGDEYKSSHLNPKPKFSYYKPDLLVINNIEYDHPDVFPDLNAYKKAFADLVAEMDASGLIVFNADDENVVDVVKNSKAKKVGFGFNEPMAGESRLLAECPELQVGGIFHNNVSVELTDASFSFSLNSIFPGLAYAYDNLSASAALIGLGFKPKEFVKYVADYAGVKRRYEIVYDGEIKIIDDYAHHPTAVKRTLEATREKYPENRIICFFEPHTYSRTKETLDDLAKAFASADMVYIADVYAAREEKNDADISGEMVADEIRENNRNVEFVANKEEALAKYGSISKPGDVIVVMAVGSFNTLAYNLKNKYGRK